MDTTLMIPIAIITLALAANSFLIWRLWAHYHRLTGKVAKKDLMSALNQLLKEVSQHQDQIEKLKLSLSNYQDWDQSGLRKIGFRRFNPFADTGGNQSFCLVVLDANNNGFMISSLHSRENTRLYSKVVAKGRVADQNLSKEEQEVLNQAINQK
jgi:hypothetical protein